MTRFQTAENRQAAADMKKQFKELGLASPLFRWQTKSPRKYSRGWHALSCLSMVSSRDKRPRFIRDLEDNREPSAFIQKRTTGWRAFGMPRFICSMVMPELMRWERSGSWKYNEEHLKLFQPTDNFFDQVNALADRIEKSGSVDGIIPWANCRHTASASPHIP